MDIKMKLPKVLYQDNQYRFVALKTTKENPAIHAIKWILSTDHGEFLHVVAEKKMADSLGGEKWDQCNVQEAQENIVKVLLLDGVGNAVVSNSKVLNEETTSIKMSKAVTTKVVEK